MGEAYTVMPLSPLRKIIASRMAEANRTIPHYRLVADVEVDALLQLRRGLNEQHQGTALSLNDVLIKATAGALMDVPAVNVHWVENEIHQYRTADISVVTAVEGGLSTPIVRGAEDKSVWDISRTVRDLTSRAARNLLKMDEIVGGSFSLSNLGMFGIDQFDAIINPPQCAILAVGAAKLRLAVSPERQARIASVMRVTLSVDHRAIDGVTAALFLSSLRKRVEEPEHLRSGPRAS